MAESRLSPDEDSRECGENLVEILPGISVHPGWKPIFQENRDLLDLLRDSIENVKKKLQDDGEIMIPEESKLLLALSRCPPEDVKVVILGHDPIKDDSLATGFAFSFPKGKFIDKNVGQREFKDKGKSLAELHDVLVEAGYLERGADYDGCHEVWADRGVLLLNASLTFNYKKLQDENGVWKGINQHFLMWKDFVSRLLFLVAKHSQQEHVFFLCWGTNAETISEQLLSQLESDNIDLQKIDHNQHSSEILVCSARLVVFISDHPTFAKTSLNQFKQQAKHQFQTIKDWYNDLFKLTVYTSPEYHFAKEFKEFKVQ